jgi:uncharacterized protein YjbI with pentapeptide repeats
MAAQSASGERYRRLTQQDVDLICVKHDRLWSARMGGARAVFTFCDLQGLKFTGRNLCDADFTGALMAEANLDNARLDNASFFGADMQGASLIEASLRRADMRGASLRGADLSGADLFECDLREGAIAAADAKKGYLVIEHANRAAQADGAILIGANLDRSRMSGMVAVKADFTDATLRDAKLVRANLKQCTLNGCNLAGADLSGADLSGADLTDAVLIGAKTFAWTVDDANLSGALTDKLSGRAIADEPFQQMIDDHARWCETGGVQGKPSVFDGADLRNLKSLRGFNLTALSAKGAVFYGLDLEGAQLQGAHLENADLRACNLRRADLRGARLSGAKLSRSDLRDAQLGPLIIGPERLLACNLSGAILKSADFARADLRAANLSGADVSRANFTGAIIKDADFTGVRREGARGLA